VTVGLGGEIAEIRICRFSHFIIIIISECRVRAGPSSRSVLSFYAASSFSPLHRPSSQARSTSLYLLRPLQSILSSLSAPFNMPDTLCGGSIGSRRGLLASLWSVVSILTATAFLTAFVYAITTKNAEDDENYYYNNGADDPEDGSNMDPEIAVTSRALAFSALWTAVLSGLMSVFGTVILGFQTPFSGQYYLCCDRSVHRTTPLGLGSFIGALMMLANLTLICSILFGEFEVGFEVF
jgi:hypothetical protein